MDSDNNTEIRTDLIKLLREQNKKLKEENEELRKNLKESERKFLNMFVENERLIDLFQFVKDIIQENV